MSQGQDSPTAKPPAEDVIRWLGVDDDKLEAAAQFIGKVAERTESLLSAFIPILESVLASLNSLAEAPETPGHEKLFRERLGYEPLVARLMTRQTHRLGQLLAEEINTGRRVRTVMDEIAKRKDCSALVISRRAKKFLDECSSERAQVVIDGAARKAGLQLTTSEFSELVEAASERNEAACRRLVRMAQQLAPCLPEKRGRPISVETCTHMVFQEFVAVGGICPSYTFSEVNGDDFVDPVTQATRLAMNNPRFNPLGAKRLRKTLNVESDSGISVRKSGPRRRVVSRR